MRRLFLSLIAMILMVHGFAQTNVNVGPWVTAITDNSLKILWTCNTPDIGWVEFEDGTKVYDTFAGRRIFDSFHGVSINGLDNVKSLKYRVGGRLLVDESNPYDPSFGDTWTGEWYNVDLFNDTDKDVTFSVTNDIHLDTVAFRQLISCVDMDKTDFIFLNGDIVSAGNYSIDDIARLEIKPLGEYAHNVPVFFARGNHEGRGNGVKNVAAVYPNNYSNSFYYGFRQGPAACFVMDAGETHDNRSVDYCGTPVYEAYLTEQVACLKKIAAEPWFAEAPLKICFIHAPMIDHSVKDDYLLQRWMNQNILPLLNDLGFDLMIGADLHEQMEALPGSMNNKFPIFVNNAANRLDVDARDGKISLKSYQPDGEQVYSAVFEY